jgi:dienelactone hydrolase
MAGTFPVAMLLGPVTSGTKELCRQLARRGFAAIAFQGGERPGDVADVIGWISAPGTPWANPDRVAVIIAGQTQVDAQALSRVMAFVLLDAPVEIEAAGRPVLGLYGAEGAPAAIARAAHGDVPASEWAFYAGAAEGFWSLASDDYQPGPAADALDRIVAFLGTSLGAAA